MWSTTLACIGKMRSTPCPKLIFRTVMLSPSPVLLRAMSVPSNACRRSLSPSLIFTWTRIVSPGRNAVWATPLFLFKTLVMTAFCMVSLQQIRTEPGRFLLSCFLPPLPDLLVVSPEQHFRHIPSAKFGRPRVLRTVQQSILAERLRHRRILVSQHARLQARHRVDH